MVRAFDGITPAFGVDAFVADTASVLGDVVLGDAAFEGVLVGARDLGHHDGAGADALTARDVNDLVGARAPAPR